MILHKYSLSFILIFIISCLLSGCSVEVPEEREIPNKSTIKKYASEHFNGKYSLEFVQETDFIMEYKIVLDKLPDLPFKIAWAKKVVKSMPLENQIYDDFEDIFKTYYIENNPLDKDISVDSHNYYNLMDDKNIIDIVKYLRDYESKYLDELKIYKKKVSNNPYGCFKVLNISSNEDIQDYIGLSDDEILKLYEKNKFRYLIYNTESYGTGRRFNSSHSKEIIYLDDETIQFMNEYAASHPNELPYTEK